MGYSSGRKSSSLKTPPSNGDYSTQKEKGQNVNRSDKMGKENTPKHDALELRRQRNLRLLVRRRRRESSVHYFHLELPRCQAPVRPSGVVSPVEKIKSWVTTKKRDESVFTLIILRGNPAILLPLQRLPRKRLSVDGRRVEIRGDQRRCYRWWYCFDTF